MLTDHDHYRLGVYVARIVGTQAALGHDNPAATTDYIGAPDHPDPMFCLAVDAFRACRTDAPEARARLAEAVERYDLLDLIADAVTRNA